MDRMVKSKGRCIFGGGLVKKKTPKIKSVQLIYFFIEQIFIFLPLYAEHGPSWYREPEIRLEILSTCFITLNM